MKHNRIKLQSLSRYDCPSTVWKKRKYYFHYAMHTSFAIYMYSPETKLSIQAHVCNFLGDFVGVLGGDDVLVEEKLMSFYAFCDYMEQ